jgi:hypothetical protein
MWEIPGSKLSWLPALLEDAAIDVLKKRAHELFKRDLLGQTLSIEGRRIWFQGPIKEGLEEESFTHIIVGGTNSQLAKVPSKIRCRYITWVKPIIDHFGTKEIKWWEDARGGSIMRCLSPIDYSSIVVLRSTTLNFVFVTAYPAENQHTSEKWKADCESYWKAKTA